MAIEYKTVVLPNGNIERWQRTDFNWILLGTFIGFRLKETD